MKKHIRDVVFFSNGNVVVFSDGSKQLPYLQKSRFIVFIDFLKEKGYTREELENIVYTFPNGKEARYIAKYDNWEFK